jgi:O-antigen/teichoic acid export membrane protein
MSLRFLSTNAAIYAVGNIGARAAIFLLIPLYTHCLSVADFGLLATLQLTIQILGVLMMGGMSTTLLRFATEYEAEGRLNTLLGTSILMILLNVLVLTAGTVLLLPWLFCQVLHTPEVRSYVGLACGAAAAQSLNFHIMSYYRARQDALRYMITGISSAVLLVGVTFVMVSVLRRGVGGALIAMILANMAVFLVVLAGTVRGTGLRVSASLVGGLLRFGVPQVCSQSSEMAIGAAGVYFLSYFHGLETVAVYSLGNKLAIILMITTISPFSMAFEPYAFSSTDKPDRKPLIARSLTYLVLAAVFASACLLVGIRILLPKIAPPEYASAFVVVLLLIPGMVFTGIYYFGQALLNATHRTGVVGVVSTAVAVLSVALNYLLIRRFGWQGAVLAFDVCSILLGSALTAAGVKHFHLTLEWKRVCVGTGLLVALLLAFFAIRELPILRFTLVCGLSMLLGVLLLLRYDFFHTDEKLLARRLAARLC